MLSRPTVLINSRSRTPHTAEVYKAFGLPSVARELGFSVRIESGKRKKPAGAIACWLADPNGQLTLTKVSAIFRSSRKYTGRKSHHEHQIPGRLSGTVYKIVHHKLSGGCEHSQAQPRACDGDAAGAFQSRSCHRGASGSSSRSQKTSTATARES
jgi:hypothetical protein